LDQYWIAVGKTPYHLVS